MAGLLAGNMLRHRVPKLFERQKSLPNNHSALLRFRSSIVGDVLGIQFKKVNMIKDVLPWKNPAADSLMYSFKNTGTFRSDRSITAGLVMEERFIAPPDLISRMSQGLDIAFDKPYDFVGSDGPCISTIPMHLLMEILRYPGRTTKAAKFDRIEGINITAQILNCNAYTTLSIPDPKWPFTRISITGNEAIIECPNFSCSQDKLINAIALNALDSLGIKSSHISNVKVSEQTYAKITPIDEELRKDFIYWATDKHNIFSLGRFATWRPGLLLDDLVKDIRLIDKWIDRGDRYALARVR